MAGGPPAGGRRPKRRRLSRSAEFDRVYREGRSRANRYLVVYSFPRGEAAEDGPRLGVSVSRKVGGAVDRNKVKRALREAFWGHAERLPEAHDLVDRDGTPGVASALGELIGDSSSEDGG